MTHSKQRWKVGEKKSPAADEKLQEKLMKFGEMRLHV